GIFYLFLKDPRLDRLAEASAEVGTVFATIVLTTGPICGKPTWGTWWTWDARLTSTLFLFFPYVGYLLVRGAVRDPALRARYAAVLGICRMCLEPFLHFGVVLLRTLHRLRGYPGPRHQQAAAAPLSREQLGARRGQPRHPVGHLRGAEMQGFIGGPRVARLEQRVGVEPQRLGTTAGRVGAGKPRRGIGMATGAAIHIARRECGIGALFEREHLLVRHERILLAEHHLPRFAQQHPGVGIRG